MAEEQYLPILGNGEVYIEGIRKKVVSQGPEFTEGYDSARKRLIEDIDQVRSEINGVDRSERLPLFVVCFRLFSRFIAKSYYPSALFAGEEVSDVGSRRWVPPATPESSLGREYSKLIFVRTSEEGLNAFQRKLSDDTWSLTDAFRKDAQKVQKVSLLHRNERLLGFDQSWESGTVELVLHPLAELTDEAIRQVSDRLRVLGVNEDDFAVARYPGGPTFIGAQMRREQVCGLADYNPLRTAHPLKASPLPELRVRPSVPGPKPASGSLKSTITLGVFDGGLDASNVLVRNYAKLAVQSVNSTENPEYVEHGTAVAGAALYGALNGYDEGSQLDTPPITVEVFRVLPPERKSDVQLYSAIDLIEQVVPQRPDINVFNLSFGPVGPILDDEITRFTYALDSLAWEHRALFVVAVGNDGRLPEPKNRIQAPSDLVNGIGVGAFVPDANGRASRAPYSSIGWGREGARVKPDVVAFGGSDQRPIHVVSPLDGEKALAFGTSFSAPIVAGRVAEILGRGERISPLLARALVIHSAQNPRGQVDPELGFGVVANVNEMLHCTSRSVTVLFQSSLKATTFARLPIPIPSTGAFNGYVTVEWTVATLTQVDQDRPDEYTQACIEDVFYPNSQMYRFREPNSDRGRNLNIQTQQDEVNRVVAAGWSQSEFPVSVAGQTAFTEQQRREELKWDTVLRKRRRFRWSSLDQPFLILHAIGRNSPTQDRLYYGVVVTVSAPSYPNNLYADILRVFNRLEPVRVRSRADVLVPIA